MDIPPIDLHVHAGNERQGVPQAAFIQALHVRGVRLAGLLDHAEFYYPELGAWQRKWYADLTARGIPFYPPNRQGLEALYRDIEALPGPDGMVLVKGLEFGNPDAPPDDFLALPDFLCCCFGVPDDPSEPSYGARAAARIRRFGRRVRDAGKPGIVNHPFRTRALVYRDLLAGGRAPSREAFVTADDVARMAAAAGEYALAVEVNLTDLAAYEKPDQRPVLDFLRYAYALLVHSGVDLSVGSDSHQPPAPHPSADTIESLGAIGLAESHWAAIRRRLGRC